MINQGNSIILANYVQLTEDRVKNANIFVSVGLDVQETGKIIAAVISFSFCLWFFVTVISLILLFHMAFRIKKIIIFKLFKFTYYYYISEYPVWLLKSSLHEYDTYEND